MKFWNYTGKFFWFRRLFGKLQHTEDYESEPRSNARRAIMSDCSVNNDSPNSGQIILFQTQGGETKIEARFADESAWLTADQMEKLFQRKL